MPQHFAGLAGAATLATGQFQLTGRIVADLIGCCATGVIHGPAATGKTYAVQAALETLAQAANGTRMTACTLAFPARPTMRLVADELLRGITGSPGPRSSNRFYLIAALTELLAGPPRLVVIDEAQRLNGDCIELLRHLHDHPATRFALLYVGGDGCWEVLSREPMLRSRVFRRLPFAPLPRAQIPALIRGYHPLYHDAGEELLLGIDDTYAHGTLRDWAVFTHTVATLCTSTGHPGLDQAVIANAYALLGGGIQ